MIALLLLALALAADAFAVALVRGAAGERRIGRALEVGFAFGLAQGLMPLLGWGLGKLFIGWMAAVDHWIAFVLLTAIGGRMLWAAMLDRGESLPPARRRHWLGLGAGALATSVDAAAAGLTLDLFAPPIALSCLVIGLVTAALSSAGYWFASGLGPRLGRYAEALGGVVLIGLGIKILLEHLGQA